MTIPKSPEENFWKHVEKSERSSCWLWRGAVSHSYGTFRTGGKTWLSHRFSYLLRHGAIDPELTIDHLCRNRLCVNPDHLEQVTNRENLRRGTGWSGRNARKTSCKHGHEFTPENTITRGNDGRRCRQCLKGWQKRHHEQTKNRRPQVDGACLNGHPLENINGRSQVFCRQCGRIRRIYRSQKSRMDVKLA